MVRHLFRGLLIGGVMATVGLVCVGESQAFLGLCNSCRPAAVPTTALSPVCNPCAQQMTCNYVPQTSYRVQYVSVPVTTYRPLMTCDPCGCQTTCMRPETCYVQRAQYVPYTTYKLVYTQSRPACATTTYYGATAAAAPSGCSTCATGGVAQATYYGTTAAYGAATVAPQVMPQAAAPVKVNYQPNYAYASGYGAPSLMLPAQPTMPTPGAMVAPAQRVIVQQTPTAVVQPGVSSIAPSYSGQTFVSPNAANGATVQPSLPTTTYYGSTTQPTIIQQAPTQMQVIQSAPPAGQVILQSPTMAPPAAGETTIVNKPADGAVKVETKTEVKVEKKADAESTDKMTPIPDPLMNKPEGPSLNKTSTPRLYDPQDKTAAAWPTERAWGYAAVGTPVALNRTVVLTSAVVPGVATANTAVPTMTTERNPATLGPIVPAQQLPVTPTRDSNGWRSSGR